ncbi:MAG TPA: hypothetical protein VMX13_03475 [Sedimentisphaerales bacterium]|nr:hypothetical protein [Sedimentisphaerales bacterium]
MSEDDPKPLGFCAEAGGKVPVKRLERCERVVVVGLIVIFLGLMLPAPMLRSPLANTHEELLAKIHGQVVSGRSKAEVMNCLAGRERRLVKQWQVGWIETVPIETEYGVVNPGFLPAGHVVVYGWPELHLGEKTWRGPWYCDASGVVHALPRSDLAASEVDSGADSLERLVRTTRFGTFEILLGGISDIGEIRDIERYDRDMVEKYLILKKLMAGDGGYMRYAIEHRCESDNWFAWLDGVLRRSVISPAPPVCSANNADSFYGMWREWYDMHGGRIEFTNSFLFERVLPDAGLTNAHGSREYVLGEKGKREEPT